jgi:hypothetical protein
VQVSGHGHQQIAGKWVGGWWVWGAVQFLSDLMCGVGYAIFFFLLS